MSTVKDILDKKGSEVASVQLDQPVIEAVKIMSQKRIGAVMVFRKDKVIGIFSERDLLNRIVLPKKSPDTTHTEEVMTRPIIFCTPETELTECRRIMSRKKIRHLPIMKEDNLAGIISIGDLMAFQLDDQQTTIRYLNEYLYGRS